MANTKISGLPAVVTPADTDEFAVNQGGVSKKETRAQIRAGLAVDGQADASSLLGKALDATVGSPSDGSILVFRDLGDDWVLEAKPAGSSPNVNDLGDVTITSVADNQVLTFDSGTGEWINQAAAGDMLASTYDPTGVGGDAFAMDNMVEGATTKILTDTERTKLSGIETAATQDQTGAEIKTLYEAEANTNAFTDTEQTKLAGIETGATADQTGAEIKTAYEAEADTNAFDDNAKSKLAGIEPGATADQTDAEIETAYNNQVPIVSQADAEAGIATVAERWTPERVKQAIDALAPAGGGAIDFTDLGDTPAVYTGGANKLVSVNATEDGLEFVAVPGGGDMLASIYDPGAVAADAFAMDNMVEGATTKILTDTERTKLAGIEAGATANTGALADLDEVTVTEIANGAVTNPKLVDMAQSTIKGRAAGAGTGDPTDLTAAQARTILNVEDGATADQTGAEIKTAYEAEADTNAFTDSEKTKLSGIEVAATQDQTGAEIKTAYEAEDNAHYLRALRGSRQGFDLANDPVGGAGTLTLGNDDAMIDVFGTPTGDVTLTIPDGLVNNEKAELITSGSWGTNTITLEDTAAQTVKVLRPDVLYQLRWRGIGQNPQWNVEGFSPRQTGGNDQVVLATGEIGDTPGIASRAIIVGVGGGSETVTLTEDTLSLQDPFELPSEHMVQFWGAGTATVVLPSTLSNGLNSDGTTHFLVWGIHCDPSVVSLTLDIPSGATIKWNGVDEAGPVTKSLDVDRFYTLLLRSDNGNYEVWSSDPNVGNEGGQIGLIYSANPNTSITADSALQGTEQGLTSSTPVTVTLDAQTPATIGGNTTQFALTKRTDQTITVQVEAGASYYLEGDDSDAAARTGAFTIEGSVWFRVISNGDGNSARYLIGGATSHATVSAADHDFNGKQVYGHVRDWLTAGGSLTVLGHSGRGIITNANVVIPTTEGFNCVLKAGGAHTVTFNGLTSAAMATGDVMTIEVQSATVINAVRTLAANLVAFA